MSTSALPASIPGGGQATFTVDFHATGYGTRTVTLQVFSDDADEGNSSITLTGRGLTPREYWRQIYFSSIDNSGDAAAENDYEADGHVNFVEYTRGMNPRSGAGQLPQWQKIGTNFATSFPQPGGVSGIRYGAEWSLTLDDASWTAIADTGTPPEHQFVVPIGSNTRMFWRFKITDSGAPISLAGAVATQSSEYFGDTCPASNAIDGNLNTFTHTDATEPAPTWTLTLPIDTEVGSILLSNRSDCCSERLRNITVQIFSDPAGTVPVFTSALLNPNHALNGPATLSVTIGKANGRVIRVYRGLSSSPVGDDRVLSLDEVQFTSP